MFILQKGISNYFVEINKSQEVIFTDKALLCLVFTDYNQAQLFQNVLFNQYNIHTSIINL